MNNITLLIIIVLSFVCAYRFYDIKRDRQFGYIDVPVETNNLFRTIIVTMIFGVIYLLQTGRFG